jgi:hypothetical protein
MSPDENKAFVRRLFAEVWNEGNFAVLDEAKEPDSAGAASASSDAPDLGSVRLDIARFRAAYPDMRFTIESQRAAGNTVVTVWTATGTDVRRPGARSDSHGRARVTGVDVTRFPG